MKSQRKYPGFFVKGGWYFYIFLKAKSVGYSVKTAVVVTVAVKPPAQCSQLFDGPGAKHSFHHVRPLYCGHVVYNLWLFCPLLAALKLLFFFFLQKNNNKNKKHSFTKTLLKVDDGIKHLKFLCLV